MGFSSSLHRFFHSYRETVYPDNQVLATRRTAEGVFEVVAWHCGFEVFYRPLKKRYGYFIRSFDNLGNAVNSMNASKIPNI